MMPRWGCDQLAASRVPAMTGLLRQGDNAFEQRVLHFGVS